MRVKSLAQLALFLLIAFFWFKIAWPLMTKEALAAGVLAGMTIHWSFTNKGNPNVIYFRPFTSGWRVLLYDMLLISFLIALAQHYGAAFLNALKNSVQNLALLLALLGGIGVDYEVRG